MTHEKPGSKKIFFFLVKQEWPFCRRFWVKEHCCHSKNSHRLPKNATSVLARAKICTPQKYILRIYFLFFRFFHSIYHPRTTLALPPSSNSDPESHRGPSSLLPTKVRAFIFIARRIQHFLPSSTRVELCHKDKRIF